MADMSIMSSRFRLVTALVLGGALGLGLFAYAFGVRAATFDLDTVWQDDTTAWRSTHYLASLSGADEVPPVAMGESTTTEVYGDFFMRTDQGMSKAQFILDVFNGKRITEAHLHCGPVGVNGPVVAYLMGEIPGGIDVSGELTSFVLTDRNIIPVQGIATESSVMDEVTLYDASTGTTTSATTTPTSADCGADIHDLPSLVSAISAGQVYVNVHSTDNPDGVIRGQVVAVDSFDGEIEQNVSAMQELISLELQLRTMLAHMRDEILAKIDLYGDEAL